MTPEEAWSGSKPSVDHFRVFGCISHVHIPDSKRTKLDDKSVKCVLLGVSEESKAYRLYDPISQKIIVSRDVKFEEENSWDWNKSYEKAIIADLDWGESDKEAVLVDTNRGNFETDHHDITIEAMEGNDSYESNEENPLNPNEGRIRRPPAWLRDYESGNGLSEEEDTAYQALFVGNDPVSFGDAVKNLPTEAKKVGVKWIYKTKFNENGEVDKYKARLVAKGYTQEHGVDYTEVFAPVARLDTIRVVISLAALKEWTIYQLDVKSAFLHGELSEEVFVEQPPGYEQKGNEQKVYRLKKALYGLKQAPRAWYSRIESYFMKEGFKKCHYEHTLFIKTGKGGKILIVCLYVDDLIFTGNDEIMFAEFKKSMMLEFDMIDLGKMRYFLGIEVMQRSDGIFINQKKYTQEVLERFSMDKCNPVHNPMVPGFKLTKNGDGVKVDSTFYKKIVGILMYLTATRPDVMFVVSLINRFMDCPTELHLQSAKRILRSSVLVLKKQPVVSLSTTEAEFIAATSCACQAIWLRRILEGLNHAQHDSTTVYCDNNSTIKLSKNLVMHGHCKHIDVRFHFLRELTKDGTIEMVHCHTQEQVADIMTKPLKLDAFLKLRDLLGVCLDPGVN
ncbi:Retrovirus-related Pol polyprotein from transposon TNT 1-94 [Vitis vinifera]|uniref:Retrovirus-related Pol polyprotein from transposon TNT 1-94 n=1 Tax=Vitis vinifera TaxID=29760 RepID=A0A438EC75_VITVI|nr:Retrovirus-related Pol polyprotein from transposon TNT 1-94 [Vitis vinifera]